MLHKALFYERINDKIHCYLCPHNCNIAVNGFGLCSVRTNKANTLMTENYGEITAIANDPIEKKPLYHFKPNSNILSVGSFGCNFSCDFCQNYSIAQFKPKSRYLEPSRLAKLSNQQPNNLGIAFTYNEPSIWYEYIYDTARYLKTHYPKQQIVLVSNDFIQEKPLIQLLPLIDAMNIDLKSFNDEYYQKTCGGRLNSVLKTIELAQNHCHIEITTLLVNSLNDSIEEVDKIARFISKLNRNIPLHLARYYPNYNLKLPATEIDVLYRSEKIARQYLNYVYIGNVAGADNSTYCPKCHKVLVERTSFSTLLYIDDSICPDCGFSINVKL